MLNLVIRFSIVTPILYFACKIAVEYYYQQTVYYDGWLALVGGN